MKTKKPQAVINFAFHYNPNFNLLSITLIHTMSKPHTYMYEYWLFEPLSSIHALSHKSSPHYSICWVLVVCLIIWLFLKKKYIYIEENLLFCGYEIMPLPLKARTFYHLSANLYIPNKFITICLNDNCSNTPLFGYFI